MVINNLYCPECSTKVQVNFECMLLDNGWILEFNLALACGFLQRSNISTAEVSPAFIFDNGYASWNGITPNELEQRLTERQEIIALAHQDMRTYLAKIRRWGCERVERFREAGWRKAKYC